MIFKSKVERHRTKVEKRVASLSTEDLLNLVDSYLYTVGRELSNWRRYEQKAYLDEAKMASDAVHAIVETIMERALLNVRKS